MVSFFCILFLALLVFCIVKLIRAFSEDPYDIEWKEAFYVILISIFAILSTIFFIWTFILINTVGTADTIDRKIAMYEEENAAIEESIDVTVRNYMDFEADTYSEFKDKDAINLVSLFPELKSDTLVQKQIEVYVSNNDKIKTLKEEKIDLSKARWKLYFGK